nr:Uma2 family endonuclease [Streptomyces mobaraensis]
MTPHRPFCGSTRQRVWSMLEAALPERWTAVGGVGFVFAEQEALLCPDLAVVPAAAARNLDSYPAGLIELTVEVVSPGSVRQDYLVKDRAYARAGIANHLILDPYQGHCVTLWNPGPDGYLGRDTIPYGKTVTIASTVGPLVFDTSGLPVDPAR